MKKFILTLSCILTSALSFAYDFEVDGMYYNITSLQNLKVELTNGDNYYTGDIVIPETVEYSNKTFTVTRLGDNCFKGCSKLNSVQIPHTVITLGTYVFYGCSKLASLTIPSSVTTIGEGAHEEYGRHCFSGCYNLTSLIIEDGESTLKLYPNDWIAQSTRTFVSCHLKYLYLGRNIICVYIDDYDTYKNPFYGQTSLTEIKFGSGITRIGYHMFQNCSSLEHIEIPNKITEIQNNAFEDCSKLSDVRMEEGVASIGSNVFKNCTSISSILFPSSITTIGSDAFLNCTNINKVYSKCDTPASIQESSFSGRTYLSAVLYVPTGTRALYEAATGWKDFSSIVETDNFEDLITYYSLNVSISIGGKVTILGNTLSNTSMSASVKEGEDVTLSFTSDEGYELKSVIVNGVDVIESVENGTFTISSISQNTSIFVTFTELPVYLTVKSADNGSIAQEVEKGKAYSFVITPSEGWDIESVSFNGENVTYLLDDNKYTTPVITTDSELNIVYRQIDLGDVKTLKNEGNVKVFVSYGKLTIENAGKFTNISVYTTSGTIVANESAETGSTTIELPTYNIYIVKVGEQTFKVSM